MTGTFHLEIEIMARVVLPPDSAQLPPASNGLLEGPYGHQVRSLEASRVTPA